jgi:16S rRNA (guanine1207-N2)-methyltransferase
MAGNNENGKRLKKWLMEFGVTVETTSKQKHQIIWGIKNNINQEKINHSLKIHGIQQVKINDYQFITKPGIYGWNKVDKGSEILIDNMPNGLQGHGADYGCGYGFLSDSLLLKCADIKAIDLIDADYQSLQCARENLKNVPCAVNFFHQDIHKFNNHKKYDWIVMNPPFHQSKKTDTDIGKIFIERAAQSLQRNATLYMVANVFLPYEKTLENNFSKVEKITQEDGFKVIFATK